MRYVFAKKINSWWGYSRLIKVTFLFPSQKLTSIDSIHYLTEQFNNFKKQKNATTASLCYVMLSFRSRYPLLNFPITKFSFLWLAWCFSPEDSPQQFSRSWQWVRLWGCWGKLSLRSTRSSFPLWFVQQTLAGSLPSLPGHLKEPGPHLPPQTHGFLD